MTIPPQSRRATALAAASRAVTGAVQRLRRVIRPTFATTENNGVLTIDNPAAVGAAAAEIRARGSAAWADVERSAR